jgi:hypothetical protein
MHRGWAAARALERPVGVAQVATVGRQGQREGRAMRIGAVATPPTGVRGLRYTAVVAMH